MRKSLLIVFCLLALPLPTAAPGGQVPPSQTTIVILGASYAKGWGTPALPGFSKVINRGVGGEVTGDMLKRFDRDVAAAQPDAVLIWGHVNDITSADPARLGATKIAAREHYQQMIQKARTTGIKVILATEVPWTEPTGLMNDLRALVGRLRGKESYARRVSAEVRELNDFVRKLAAEQELRLLDFERVFVNDSGTRRSQFSAEDASHISQAGYAALTEYSVRTLQHGTK